MCDFAVYIALDYFADSNGRAWPGLSKIAKKAHASVPTAKRSLRRLIELGYLRKEQRRKAGSAEFDSSVFTLAFRAEGSVPTEPRVGSERTGGRVTQTPGRVKNDWGVGSVRSRNETNINEIKTPPYPPQAGGYEFEKISPPSEESFSEIDPLRVQKTETKNKPPKTKDKGERAENSDNSAKEAHYEKVDANFLDFWEAYPKKYGEAAARKAWRKLFPFGRDASEYRATLTRIGDRLSGVLTRIDEGDLEPRFAKEAKNWLHDEDFTHD
jgi:hypothetical protein